MRTSRQARRGSCRRTAVPPDQCCSRDWLCIYPCLDTFGGKGYFCDMSRRKISPETQARILAESRRRCAICFGLERDLSRKKGQIAHLDQDPNNNAPDNLAFLCTDHHDEYDSTTRQSKGLTKLEVQRYRQKLLKELERLWAAGELDAPPPLPAPSLVVNISNVGGAGGAGGAFGGGGGGGGAPFGAGGAGGHAPTHGQEPKA